MTNKKGSLVDVWVAVKGFHTEVHTQLVTGFGLTRLRTLVIPTLGLHFGH